MQLPNYPDLVSTVRSLGLVNFVETGCYLGNGVQWALDSGFKAVHSCDVVQYHVQACRGKFAGRAVQIHFAESVAFLEDVLPRLKGPTLFFLDAHFPNYYRQLLQQKAERHREYPLYDECLLIRTLKPDHANDLIICDDVDSVPGFPGTLRGDRLPYQAPFSYSDLVGLFDATHIPLVPFREEAVVTFVPKRNQ